MTVDAKLRALGRLAGRWLTEAEHPAMPGLVVRGEVDVEWLEGGRFLVLRSRTDHVEFPDSISVMGVTGWDRADDLPGDIATDESQLHMHYFDSRGVFRAYEVDADGEAWWAWRNAPGFSQRFRGDFAEDGDVIDGRWQLSTDGARWDDDLRITYRRV